jgi:hypothetical protein
VDTRQRLANSLHTFFLAGVHGRILGLRITNMASLVVIIGNRRGRNSSSPGDRKNTHGVGVAVLANLGPRGTLLDLLDLLFKELRTWTAWVRHSTRGG